MLEKIIGDIAYTLVGSGVAGEKGAELLVLTEKEVRLLEGDKSGLIQADGNMSPLERIAAAGRALRLAGEYPYYTAAAAAIGISSDSEYSTILKNGGDLKGAIKKLCGLKFESELIQMIAEACTVLPDLRLQDVRKVEIMKEAHRKGFMYEVVYHGCAQCHMAAVSDITGKEDPVMFRAANGFAAGMGLLGDGVCGGYSGGILSLGMYAGRRKEFFNGDKEEKDLCTKLVGKLHKKYMDTFGTVTCHDIHREIFGRAFHITKSEDKEAFEKAGAHTLDKCPSVVGTSAAWVAEILLR